jgi:hypothetical protein
VLRQGVRLCSASPTSCTLAVGTDVLPCPTRHCHPLKYAVSAASTEVLKYLVAEDFFAAAGQEARDMMPAVVAAVKVRPQPPDH